MQKSFEVSIVVGFGSGFGARQVSDWYEAKSGAEKSRGYGVATYAEIRASATVLQMVRYVMSS